MEAVINMSNDKFILHEWEKEKWDAFEKNNELEDAKKEGIEKGKSIGFEEGKIIGIKEKEIEIAKNLLNMKMSIEDISKATSLTIEEIEKLKSTKEEI